MKTERLRKEFIVNKDNPNLSFDEMKVSSNDMCIWRCSVCNAEWETHFKSRAGQKNGKERGCRECAKKAQGKRVTNRAIKRNGVIADNKELIKEWDFNKNKFDPYKTPLSKEDKAFWICQKCNYHFKQSIVKRYKNKQGCPKCAGKVVEPDNSMAVLVPEIYDYIDVDYEYVSPTQYRPNSHNDIHLKCPNCGYKWITKPYVFAKGHRCKACAGLVATKEHNLETEHPQTAKLFLEEKNGIKAIEVAPHSNKKYYFSCGTCGQPVEKTVDKAVNRGVLCKKCANRFQTSYPEQAILFYAKRYFGENNVENRFRVENKKELELNVYLKNKFTGIEYDSLYYHKDKKEKDIKKETLIKQKGIDFYRIVEVNKLSKNKKDNIIELKKNFNDCDLSDAIIKLFKTIDKTKCYNIEIAKDKNKILKALYTGSVKNNILSLFPKIKDEWDYEKNHPLKPEFFTYGSNYKAWWVNKDGTHSYSRISSRVLKYKKQNNITSDRCPNKI